MLRRVMLDWYLEFLMNDPHREGNFVACSYKERLSFDGYAINVILQLKTNSMSKREKIWHLIFRQKYSQRRWKLWFPHIMMNGKISKHFAPCRSFYLKKKKEKKEENSSSQTLIEAFSNLHIILLTFLHPLPHSVSDWKPSPIFSTTT